MYINYEYYKIFYYAAKYGSFTQAAEVLMSNQPNITRAVRNLETELNCTLFVRTNRGVSLTPEGKLLFAHVSVAVEELQAGESELSRDKSLQSGTVTLSVSETALHGLFLSVINIFRKKYPGVRIRILNHSTLQAVSALRSGTVDLALVTTPTDITKPLKETLLMEFKEILVGGTEFSYLKNKQLRFSDLDKYPFICLGKDTKTNEFFRKLFLKHDIIMKPDMEAATTDQLLSMVKNNLGLGFLPNTSAEPSIENGEIIKLNISESIPTRYICMLKNTNHPLSIAAKELEKILLRHQNV